MELVTGSKPGRTSLFQHMSTTGTRNESSLRVGTRMLAFKGGGGEKRTGA